MLEREIKTEALNLFIEQLKNKLSVEVTMKMEIENYINSDRVSISKSQEEIERLELLIQGRLKKLDILCSRISEISSDLEIARMLRNAEWKND